ncbi:MAG: hypothetical protein NZ651_01115 [Candidatus Bipolaricaulota bacterium]|nr:hypothetical protein [Candidatus Bipolaricaulota bacterium]MDW8126368.1 hypothetical protein [Candidatus Bipolaricaulota bacterium]
MAETKGFLGKEVDLAACADLVGGEKALAYPAMVRCTPSSCTSSGIEYMAILLLFSYGH